MFIKDLTTRECFEILTEKRVGRLACSHKNQPYVVPFHFAFDGGKYLYAFSTLGQKIRWMRENPLVCVEVDDIKNQFEWTSLVIFGRYEELADAPQFETARTHAYELLSRHPMWWHPACAARSNSTSTANSEPIYFRLFIDKVTGHRAVSDELPIEPGGREVMPETHQNWFLNFWKSQNPVSISNKQ